MSAQPIKTLRVDDYFEWERANEGRFEYLNGEIFAMAGASQDHNQITFNLSGLFYNILRGRICRTFATNMRVKLSPNDYTYPDIVIVCQPPLFERTPLDTLMNPTFIIEVLSESTEAYDRTTKFRRYRQNPSFKEYVLISQDEMLLEQHVRQVDGGWLMKEWTKPDDRVRFPSIDCELRLADIYEQVSWLTSSENSSEQ